MLGAIIKEPVRDRQSLQLLTALNGRLPFCPLISHLNSGGRLPFCPLSSLTLTQEVPDEVQRTTPALLPTPIIMAGSPQQPCLVNSH